jgi:methionyl aminopeptidase
MKSKFTTVKTKEEIKSMRKGGKILYKILHEIGRNSVEGAIPKELDKMAHSLCSKYNVKPAFYKLYDFPASFCSSVNDEVVHGIPNDKPLKNQDIFTVDFGVELDGLMTDSAYSFIIGGKSSKKVKKFLDTINKALYTAIDICKDGVRVGDIGAVIEEVISSQNYGIVEDLGGHGIGQDVHEDPHIFNYGNYGTGAILRKGMTIAIEPIANMGSGNTFTDTDGWTIKTSDGSLSGQFEHTVMIGETKGEILTMK